MQWVATALLMISLSPQASPLATSSLDEARDLLRQSNPLQAYEYLLSLEKALGNNADYNYLLGVASLQTGHFSQARNAFERTLLLEPHNAGAHLDLAITEIEMKNFAEAQRLLLLVEQKFDPPPAIASVIHRYRQRIARELQPRNEWTGSLFSSYGYQSNVNNGIENSLIELDLGNGPSPILVGENSKPKPDNYYDLGGSLNYGLSMGRWKHAILSAIQVRKHEQLNEYDTLDLLAGGTSSFSYEKHETELGLFYSAIQLDGEDYQSSLSGHMAYTYKLTRDLRLTGMLRLNQIRYLQTQVHDINRVDLSLSAGYSFNLINTNNLLQGTMYFSSGKAQNQRPGGDQRKGQLRIAWVNQPTAAQLLRLSAFVAREEDTDTYSSTFGDRVRVTDKQGVELTYSYYLSPALSLTLAGSVARNRSTIELFTTDSNNLSLKLRYDF